MMKLALLLVTFGFLTSVLALPAIADDVKTVNATVTPFLVSVTVDPTEVDYGLQALGDTAVTPNPEFFDVTNNGTVVEDFLIKGGGSTNWNLGAVAGDNTFVHRFSTSGNVGTFTALTTSNQPLFNDVPAITGSIPVYLNLDMPITSSATEEQTLPVTVMAVQTP